jgi:hypothetical protein
MSDVSAQYDVATMTMARRQEKLEGQQSVQLIDGAGSAGKGAPPPPQQPVAVTPRAGSTIEVVA